MVLVLVELFKSISPTRNFTVIPLFSNTVNEKVKHNIIFLQRLGRAYRIIHVYFTDLHKTIILDYIVLKSDSY
jgi:hypothetical protein